VSELADAIRAGDRRALARGITLVESTRPDHREQASELLDALLPATGSATRVGVSGAPGVGKSTFIESLGQRLTSDDHRVAVLAVDPSSSRSGGSILGDKTRMSELARDPNAFIRPSPSGGALGGVARRTREAMLLCEAAGFDVVLVETVGVGQSEIDVESMVDVFVLLVQPGGGDELQGLKRGIVELADVIVVTKADGDLADAAKHAEADYRHATRFLRPKDGVSQPQVLRASSVTGDGIGETWAAVRARMEALTTHETLTTRRAGQASAWLWREINDRLADELRHDPAVAGALRRVEDDVRTGAVSPRRGADLVLRSRRATDATPPAPPPA
jgi:LAO/AO transport system kinase